VKDLRTGGGHYAFQVDVVFNRHAQRFAIWVNRPVVDERAIAREFVQTN
jgi:hypothetical protein